MPLNSMWPLAPDGLKLLHPLNPNRLTIMMMKMSKPAKNLMTLRSGWMRTHHLPVKSLPRLSCARSVVRMSANESQSVISLKYVPSNFHLVVLILETNGGAYVQPSNPYGMTWYNTCLPGVLAKVQQWSSVPRSFACRLPRSCKPSWQLWRVHRSSDCWARAVVPFVWTTHPVVFNTVPCCFIFPDLKSIECIKTIKDL